MIHCYRYDKIIIDFKIEEKDMLNIRPVLNLRNKFMEIEKALDEADYVAKSIKKRLTKKEVFNVLRKKINAK